MNGLPEVERQVNNFKSTQNSHISHQAAERIKTRIQQAYSILGMMTTVVYEEFNLERSLDLLAFAAKWILRIANAKREYPTEMIALPLPNDIPVGWGSLPQFLFHIITDITISVTRYHLGLWFS